MNINSIIYICLAIFLSLKLIKRRIDLLLISAFCFIIYSMYCAVGIGISGQYRPDLSDKLYFLIFIQIIIILCNLHYHDKHEITMQSLSNSENTTIVRFSFYIYTAIMFVFMISNVMSVGLNSFAQGKNDVWGNVNILYIISLYGAFPSFAYGIHYGEKYVSLAAILIEALIFFAGARAFMATLIVIYFCNKGQQLWIKNKSNFIVFLSASMAVIFMLFYRMIDKMVMYGDFHTIYNFIFDIDVWLTALEFNEPRVIIANYDYIVNYDFRLPFVDIIYRFIDFVPGLTKILPITTIYPEYFSDILDDFVMGSTGVGGTIWGEWYAMFGTLGVVIGTFLWLRFLCFCNVHLSFHKPYSPFLVSLGVYMGWYINRLDFNRVGQISKVIFMCFCIWAIIYILLGGALKIGKYIFKI